MAPSFSVTADLDDRWMRFSKRAVKDGYYHVHDQESTRFTDSVPLDLVCDMEEQADRDHSLRDD